MKNRAVYHVSFWAGIYLLWVIAFRSYSVALTKTLTVEFCYLIFITASYYTINDFLIPEFLRKKKYVSFVAMTLTTTAISAGLRSLVAREIGRHLFHSPSVDFVSLYIGSFINIFFWVMLITAGKMLLDKIRIEKEFERLEQEKVQNELDFLKAQINPHALFNSLNTIYGHIDKSNQEARNILLRFSELLRYQLYDCSAEEISLQKEIDYLRNYIAFQQLRKDENLAVRADFPETDYGLQIAPLLIVVLVENAFKFVGSHSDKENRITIDLRLESGTLSVCIENSCEPERGNGNPSGIGISNLKRRLELLYPGKHQLSNIRGNDVYQSFLTIDLS